MTGISDSLMLAMLSMDAYNRDGAGAHVNVLETESGDATTGIFLTDDLDSFDAQFYSWHGQKVIVYRAVSAAALEG